MGKLKPRSPVSLLLIAIFVIALLLRAGVAIHFPSVEWGDEIFSSLVTSALFAWRSPRWTHLSGGLIAMDQLSQDSSVCGVGLYNLWWVNSGGYSHLHRNVPIILVRREAELESQAPGFNALVMSGTFTDQNVGFKSAGCWNGVCLYRRAGSCIASSQYNELNKVLRETGR